MTDANENYSYNPIDDLIQTIPSYQLQGIKVSNIVKAMFIEEREENKILRERNEYLTNELYGKKKNKENPEDEEKEKEESEKEDSTSANVIKLEEAKKKLLEAKKRYNSLRPKSTPKPIGEPKKQTVRIRIPSGIFCLKCHTEVKDKGNAGHNSTEIDFMQPQMIERTNISHEGACDCGEIQLESPRPVRPIENTNYSPSFITNLILNKFRWHTPIYRQSAMFAQLGIQMNRSTMNRLVNKAWEVLKPLLKRLKEEAQSQEYKYCDETPICMIKDKKSLRHYLWCLYTDKAVYFESTATRNQKLAKSIIGSGGKIMTDALGIYSKKSIDGEHGNCLAHAIQYFFRSFTGYPDESKEAIDYIVRVYDIELEAKVNGLSKDERLALRKEKAAPIMEKLKEFLLPLNPPPKSYMAKAKNYCLDHWEKLTLFLRDGGIEVDNNRVESIFRDVKLGLKNYLFVQSVLGSEALAGFFSLIVTCNRYNLNLYEYFSDVLYRIADGHPQSKIDDLLPWNWEPDKNKIQIDPDKDYIELDYPPDLFIKRLGLEGKIYYCEEINNSPHGLDKSA